MFMRWRKFGNQVRCPQPTPALQQRENFPGDV